MQGQLEHLTFQLPGVSIHAAAAGPKAGPLAVLLHGYPEFWYGWRSQIVPLAEAGFRVIAPDQRGYNESSKPEGWRPYQAHHLVGDVLGIADALARERFCLAGHDWGGIIAWASALAHPERIERLAVLNAPHPRVFQDYIRTHPAQILRSWYMFFMQIPWLPEFLFEAANFRFMTEALVNSSRPGTFSQQDLEKYCEAWRKPGAPTAMINWYRTLRAARPISNPAVSVPVKILWGAQDRFLAADMARLSLQFCQRGELQMFPNATHWLQHEEPAAVSDALIAFFSASWPSKQA